MTYLRLTFCFFICLTFFACKSSKTINEGEELNMTEETDRISQRPDGKMTKVDLLIEEIVMDEEDAIKFREIYYYYQEKRMELRQKGGKPNTIFKEVLAMRDAQNKKVKKFLNDDQYERYLIAIKDKKGRPVMKKHEQPRM